MIDDQNQVQDLHGTPINAKFKLTLPNRTMNKM